MLGTLHRRMRHGVKTFDWLEQLDIDVGGNGTGTVLVTAFDYTDIVVNGSGVAQSWASAFGESLTMTFTGSPVVGTGGITLDGVDDRCYTAATSAIDVGGPGTLITICAGYPVTGYETFCCVVGTTDSIFRSALHNNGNISSELATPNGFEILDSGVPLSGVRRMVVCSYAGNGATEHFLQVWGAAKTSTSIQGTLTGGPTTPQSSYICLGSQSNVHANVAPGEVSAVLWFNTVLTDAQVQTVWDAVGDRFSVSSHTGNTVDGLTLTPAALTLTTGNTYQLTAQATASGVPIPGESILYESSDDTKATVSATGLVTAVATGTATITATAASTAGDPIPVTDTCAVTTATAADTYVVISPTSASVDVSATTDFDATVYDQSEADAVALLAYPTATAATFSSLATGTATVNSTTGLATGVAAGTTTIRATAGALTDDASLTVTAVGAVATVKMHPQYGAFMVQGETRTFTPKAYDSLGAEVTGRTWTSWTSSNTSWATVNSSGVVTAVLAPTPSSTNFVTISATDSGSGKVASTKLIIRASAHPNMPAGLLNAAPARFPRQMQTKASSDSDRGTLVGGEYVGGSEGWDGIEYKYGKLTIGADIDDPYVTSGKTASLAHGNYRNQKGGSAAFTMQCAHTNSGPKLYIHLFFIQHPTWFGNSSGTNKRVWAGFGPSGNEFFISSEGTGNNPLRLCMRMQGGDVGQLPRLFPNMVNTSHPYYYSERGVAEEWEMVVELDSGNGAFDGSAEMWKNGVKIHEWLGVINWTKPGETYNDWWLSKIEPTYGGGSGDYPDQEAWLKYGYYYAAVGT